MKLKSHLTFSPPLSREIKYDSIIDLMIHNFLDDLYNTISPSSVKTHPLANFESFVQHIQLALLYHYSIIR